jgi:hypothetical protein
MAIMRVPIAYSGASSGFESIHPYVFHVVVMRDMPKSLTSHWRKTGAATIDLQH